MDLPDEDTIRILITTDNHVGYNENDPITGDDSWKTFHEIMMIAKDYQVDMILQSGDLFHINKPSKKSLYQVMRSIRLTCMGDKPCELELLSDASKVLGYSDFTNVNYEDPNFNISIPMFAISGNHDDATGDSLLCPMDILHVSGLVNHFGKVLETDKICLSPLLFQKGKTKLALYGLQSIREERLFRTFKEGGVTFEVPTIRDGEWFNLMCVHQNHIGHTNTAFLPEQFLPDFLDLVIWGHEHECIPNLIFNPIKGFNVLQPGSSVATSLCDAEAKPKNVFILEINYKQNKSQPRLIPIPLTTIRTFKMRNISLNEVPFLKPHDKESITKYLIGQVNEMIDEANKETIEKLRQNGIEVDQLNQDDILNELSISIPLPLIRLRVNYTGPTSSNSSTGSSSTMTHSRIIVNDMLDYQVENPRRFSNRFVGRVANSNNIVQYYKKKTIVTKNKDKNASPSHNRVGDLSINSDENNNSNDGELQIELLVNDLLSKMQLSLLPEVGFNDAIKKFVDKDEKTALKEFIDKELDNEVDLLVSSGQFLDKENPEDIKLLIKEVKRVNTSRKDSSSLSHFVSEENSINVHKELPDNSSFSTKSLDKINMPSQQSFKPTKSVSSIAETLKTGGNSAFRESSPDSIIISDSDENNRSFDHDHIIVDDGSGDNNKDEDYSKQKSTISKQSFTRRKHELTGKSQTSNSSRRKIAKTPRTDILESFLAKKRR